MKSVNARPYFVIPLSVQKEGDLYLVGNADMGDFYQFPEQGVRILSMLQSGEDAETIKSRLIAEDPELFDVDEFVEQLSSIGFVHHEDEKLNVEQRLEAMTQDKRRTFNVDPRIARAIFSPAGLLCALAIVLYAALSAIETPQLRINFNAFYTETNRTLFIFLLMGFSFVMVVLHESGHMLAAAKHGIKSKYGFGNRLWTIVAESDLTGILTLPKSQRYFPMLAGLLVDIICASALTIALQIMLLRDAGAFAVQVVQALILDILVTIPWQFNIFIKTDIYFVICNYLSLPDIDRDARKYLNHILYRATWGRLGRKSDAAFQHLAILRVFSLIWLFGRILSVLLLVGVIIPTLLRYLLSAVHLLTASDTSFWVACDTIAYVTISLTMLGIGMAMWIKQR